MKNCAVFSLSVATYLLLSSHSVLAAGTRTQAFASTAGYDKTNCGSMSDPCRTLQYAIANAVVSGGVLYLTTPGDYQPATITTSVSVINVSGAAAGVFKSRDGQPAIYIPATAPIAVKLRGLTLDGGGVFARTSWDAYAGKSSLGVTDCVIQNAASGLSIEGTSGIPIGSYVAGTSFRNVDVGVRAAETRDTALAPFAVDTTTASANVAAFQVSMSYTTLAITNSFATGAAIGLQTVNTTSRGYLGGKTLVDNFSATGNNLGLSGIGGGLIVSRSTIGANTIGLRLEPSPYPPGPNQTLLNNIIEGNVEADITGEGPLLTPLSPR